MNVARCNLRQERGGEMAADLPRVCVRYGRLRTSLESNSNETDSVLGKCHLIPLLSCMMILYSHLMADGEEVIVLVFLFFRGLPRISIGVLGIPFRSCHSSIVREKPKA